MVTARWSGILLTLREMLTGIFFLFGAMPYQNPIQIDWPGALDTYILGINDDGLILIYANMPSGGIYILDDESSGTYARDLHSDYQRTTVSNNRSQIVGANLTPNCVDGLILDSGLQP